MRHWTTALAAVVFAACADQTPTAPPDLQPDLHRSKGHGATRLHTRMLPELEVPISTSQSKGIARIKVHRDGTLESHVFINNKSRESVRFGHIHRVNPGSTTGPVIWWLTQPVGVDLNLTNRVLFFHENGIFVTNPHFATHEAALAELVRDPQSFYVNFHSDAFPPGFARGFLGSACWDDCDSDHDHDSDSDSDSD